MSTVGMGNVGENKRRAKETFGGAKHFVLSVKLSADCKPSECDQGSISGLLVGYVQSQSSRGTQGEPPEALRFYHISMGEKLNLRIDILWFKVWFNH